MLTTNNTDLLPIVIEGQTFKPNAEGLWSLTEINRALPGLTKPPAQWRGRDRDYFDHCANLHSENGGSDRGTYATERATIAYAMSCSLDFYVMVIDAFVAMRNSALRELRHKDALLDANMPKASTLDLKARGAGLTWTEACRVAGIQQPRLAMDVLVAMKSFVYPVDSFGSRTGSPRPKKQGFEVKAFVKVSSDFGNREGWRVKPRGLDWLQGKAQEINIAVAVADANRRKAQAKKAAQASRVDQWGRTVKL
ncbi:hypothetical protein IFR35_16430 [Pseudomonas fluorescens]|uniref:hypothetical protein n=1 Tax=Pseudomonas fluorescens TaxID=294 RepID=UPI00177E9B66|nr:hypothetical protein [Pseudomonas fluorescens]MBD8193015.1 hypothetical protein [Pseudomonas fluorescens]MBD8227837.1 hypothetical protein [Pseudomonas fluorescens]MBD8785803.1 hypothetical protein [Pseudomonas fluorescens]MBD8818032.1 hypothetical protein [Pseudomonas fluorescens]